MEKRAKQRIERTLFRGIYLDDLHPERAISTVKAKRRSRIAMLWFNVLAILLFSYSVQSGLSNLPRPWLIVLVVVFSLNVMLIGWQISQLRQLLDHYAEHHATTKPTRSVQKLP